MENDQNAVAATAAPKRIAPPTIRPSVKLPLASVLLLTAGWLFIVITVLLLCFMPFSRFAIPGTPEAWVMMFIMDMPLTLINILAFVFVRSANRRHRSTFGRITYWVTVAVFIAILISGFWLWLPAD